MFIRVKNIKNQSYAYKVSNKWTRKGTRQRTQGYLGRVFAPTPLKEFSFEEFISQEYPTEYASQEKEKVIETYLKLHSSQLIIQDLIRYELIKHGFCYKGRNRNILHIIYKGSENNLNKEKANGIKASTLKVELAPSILSISDTKKPVVLSMNNDFLCNYTLRKLINFKSFSTEEECGKELAKDFILAAIPVQPWLFVEIFKKVYSQYGSYVK